MAEHTSSETLDDGSGGATALFPIHPYIFVVLECDRPGGGGSRHSLVDIDEVVLGRGSERSAVRERVEGVRRLTIRVPGRWLSGVHAKVVARDGRWVVEDAGSRNGTFVHGVSLTRATLHDGDVIDAGHTLFRFRDALPTPPGTPLDVLVSEPSPDVSLLPHGMARLAELRRVAKSGVPVLVLGETGSGKEVLARMVHAASGRPGELVAVNCGALSATLLEALLFGHVRGSFSGAVRDEPGLVRAADRGTLFLDEIGDLPKPAQAALLRVLQEREVVPVGSVRPVKVDVRVVAATHRPLAELVEQGEFRADLYARLNGFVHTVPPLRERVEDMGLLVSPLLARAVGDRASAMTLATDAGRALLSYGWPANVRELEQCLARAAAVAPGATLELAHFPEAVRGKRTGKAPTLPPLSEEDQQLRAKLVEELRTHQGNVSEVARSMRKARMQIQRWLKRLQIDAEDFRD